MRLFHNDYNAVCHAAILQYMADYAQQQMPGYSTDSICADAAKLIRKQCGNDDLAVHFLVGGTQTNMTVIAAALRPHQAVISADSGHINVHETGAVESTGHKVIAIASKDGKITAEQIRCVVEQQRNSEDAEHIAQPKMVYISNPTEYGTTYKRDELRAISEYCRKNCLYLYLDGARLGYALAAADNDITLADYAELCDAFYIGGTKVGAMFGEALVISAPEIAEDFRYIIKQRGGMLAKGWLLGMQYKVLFENNLYYEISLHADRLADMLRKTLIDCGFSLFLPGTTNQVFVSLPNQLLDRLGKNFSFAVWEKVDADHTVVRFCTSWATKEEDLLLLCDAIRKLA